MFRAVYRQIARFLNWVNRTGSGSSASRATREAADHRRDLGSRAHIGGFLFGVIVARVLVAGGRIGSGAGDPAALRVPA